MRKFLVFLLMSLMTTMAWGVHVVTFIPGEDYGLQPTVVGEDCMSKDCVTICCTRGAFGAAQYRFGKNSVTTVSATCGTIIKIVFECIGSGNDQYGPGCFSAGSGEYSYEGKIGVWEGAETEALFTAVTNQVRVVRIDVYFFFSSLLLLSSSNSLSALYTICKNMILILRVDYAYFWLSMQSRRELCPI